MPPGFLRGFGKIAARNSDSYGLLGERAFADSQGAIRFNSPIFYKQDDWKSSGRVHPWFRRFYFDGYSAGRFEIGLLIYDDFEDFIRVTDGSPYEISGLADAVLSAPVTIRSLDGSETEVELGACGEALAMAYVLATTRNDALAEFPAAETAGKLVTVGRPTLQLRVNEEMIAGVPRDARILSKEPGDVVFVTSSSSFSARNNVIVQCSSGSSLGEVPMERARRVIFSHINAIIFSNIEMLSASEALIPHARRKSLADSVARSVRYFEGFQPADINSTADVEFARAVREFGAIHSGRLDELVTKLQAMVDGLSKPTFVEKSANAGKALMELILTTTIKATVEAALKAR